MTDIQFYQLTVTPLERALPKLLEKALAGSRRAVVYCGSEERAEQLNQLLWTYDPNSFLPHGTAKDGNAERQPVYLAASRENPNEATVAIVLNGEALADMPGFTRIIDLYDGREETSVNRAAERRDAYRAAGHRPACLRQGSQGGWEQQAD